ncbi:MAG: hypothetical protein ACLP50_22865 [Solirubrobacteraceae bacterium]
MSIQFDGSTVILAGSVSVEDAEPLAGWLRETPDAAVDLGSCTHLHTAALQALASAHPRVAVAPTDAFLATWVAPLLAL